MFPEVPQSSQTESSAPPLTTQNNRLVKLQKNSLPETNSNFAPEK